VPFYFVSCIRTGDRVDCVVEQRMLALVPFETTTIRGLDRAEVVLEAGSGFGTRRTTDTYFVVLTDNDDHATKFMLDSMRSPSDAPSKALVDGINAFIASDDEHHSDWAVALLGYGPFLPAALGAIFLMLVGWNFVSTRLGGGERATRDGTSK
jgi:hypothetical protein